MDYDIPEPKRPNNYFVFGIAIKAFKCMGIYFLYSSLFSPNILGFSTQITVLCLSIFIFSYLAQSIISGDNKISFQKLPILRITVLGIIQFLLLVFFLYGLLLSGPLRTIFIFETSDFIYLAILSLVYDPAFKKHKNSPIKIRGILYFVIAICAFLLIDHDDSHNILSPNSEEPKNHFNAPGKGTLIGKLFGLADHKKGICLLIFLVFLRIIQDTLIRRTSINTGGLRKTHMLTCGAQTIVAFAFWALSYFSNAKMSLLEAWLFPTDYSTPLLESTRSPDFFTQILYAFTIVFIGFIWIAQFYTEITLSLKMDKFKTARILTLTSYVSAFIIYLIKHHITMRLNPEINNLLQDSGIENAHPLTFGAYVAIILAILGVLNLTINPNENRSTKGFFIGYTYTGAPLYTYTSDLLSTKISKPFWTYMKHFLLQITRDKTSKPIFYFLCANLAFMLVEILYGAWSNSLGLISDGFHMAFDCSALVMGLVASIMSKWKPNKTFTFGYGRVEVLSGFLNGLFLILIAFNVFMAALDRLFEPPKIESEKLLLVSVIGLVINLIGIFAFHLSGECSHHHNHGHTHHHVHEEHVTHSTGCNNHTHKKDDKSNPFPLENGTAINMSSHPFVVETNSNPHKQHNHKDNFEIIDIHNNNIHNNEHKHCNKHELKQHNNEGTKSHSNSHKNHHDINHGHSHGPNANMQGVFLHVLADTLGSVGVIVSSFLISRFGWYIADPICSLFTATLIFLSVCPLLRSTCEVLLLKSTPEIKEALKMFMHQINQINPNLIKNISYPLVWKHTNSNYIGTVHVLIDSKAALSYEQTVTQQVNHLMRSCLVKTCGSPDLTLQCTVQVEREEFYKHMEGINNKNILVNRPTNPYNTNFYTDNINFNQALNL